MVPNELLNGVNQFWHASEHASPDPFRGEFAEEAFDQIEPGAARGCEMHMESGMPLEPPLHLRVLVGRIVVGDEMQGFVLGGLSINQPQEGEPFRVAMARETRGDDFPFCDIQGRKEGRGAMPFIVMRQGPTPALSSRAGRVGCDPGLEFDTSHRH